MSSSNMSMILNSLNGGDKAQQDVKKIPVTATTKKRKIELEKEIQVQNIQAMQEQLNLHKELKLKSNELKISNDIVMKLIEDPLIQDIIGINKACDERDPAKIARLVSEIFYKMGNKVSQVIPEYETIVPNTPQICLHQFAFLLESSAPTSNCSTSSSSSSSSMGSAQHGSKTKNCDVNLVNQATRAVFNQYSKHIHSTSNKRVKFNTTNDTAAIDLTVPESETQSQCQSRSISPSPAPIVAQVQAPITHAIVISSKSPTSEPTEPIEAIVIHKKKVKKNKTKTKSNNVEAKSKDKSKKKNINVTPPVPSTTIAPTIIPTIVDDIEKEVESKECDNDNNDDDVPDLVDPSYQLMQVLSSSSPSEDTNAINTNAIITSKPLSDIRPNSLASTLMKLSSWKLSKKPIVRISFSLLYIGVADINDNKDHQEDQNNEDDDSSKAYVFEKIKKYPNSNSGSVDHVDQPKVAHDDECIIDDDQDQDCCILWPYDANGRSDNDQLISHCAAAMKIKFQKLLIHSQKLNVLVEREVLVIPVNLVKPRAWSPNQTPTLINNVMPTPTSTPTTVSSLKTLFHFSSKYMLLFWSSDNTLLSNVPPTKITIDFNLDLFSCPNTINTIILSSEGNKKITTTTTTTSITSENKVNQVKEFVNSFKLKLIPREDDSIKTFEFPSVQDAKSYIKDFDRVREILLRYNHFNDLAEKSDNDHTVYNANNKYANKYQRWHKKITLWKKHKSLIYSQWSKDLDDLYKQVQVKKEDESDFSKLQRKIDVVLFTRYLTSHVFGRCVIVPSSNLIPYDDYLI